VILLDTNAVLWALVGHPRAAPLWEWRRGLYISPVSMLELRFLLEAGKLREAPGFSLRQVADDPRWSLDSPASDALFDAALELDWTRDPFDRLLVAHSRLRRWRLATGDRQLGRHLPAKDVMLL
jgi:PIN domain nuclease of toxin-antitoxin system